jgi:hypothetical protein
MASVRGILNIQSPNELTSETCLSSPRATRCVHEASRRPAGQPRDGETRCARPAS